MGLLLAVGKRSKNMKKKLHHKTPYRHLSFCGEGLRSRRYGLTAILRLLVQPYDEAYYYYYYYCCHFPGKGAQME
jgi:hypothetical protein